MERVVNLTFHGVGSQVRTPEAGEDELWLTYREFDELLDAVAGRSDVRLTFDDGNISDIEVVLPRLRTRGLSATFFVVAGRLGERGYVGADDVADLASAGMGIGVHGMWHRSWRGLDDDELHLELVAARGYLEDIVGVPITMAACPFGSYDRRVLRELRKLGYTRVFTSDGGMSAPDAWLQPRNTVRRGEGRLALERALGPRPGRLVRPLKVAIKRWR